MRASSIFLLTFLLISTTGIASAESIWINNITINEYNITWGYTEIFSGMDALAYRTGIDAGLGNNDSFISAWEVLKVDKKTRKEFRDSIKKEMDIRINNESKGIELVDVDSSLSDNLIGKTHNTDKIENKYKVTYSLKTSFLNASSIWFLGQPDSPVSIKFPEGIDVFNISGMDNITISNHSYTQVAGTFLEASKGRGEITVNITRNASYKINEIAGNLTGLNNKEKDDNLTRMGSEVSKKIIDWTIAGTGIILIILVYIFKVKNK